jgi:hypothetical protein
MNKAFFVALCETTGVPFRIANKIIDGRYKFGKNQYLSSLDDKYYQGNDSWDAKVNALNSAIKKFGKEVTAHKLSMQ